MPLPRKETLTLVSSDNQIAELKDAGYLVGRDTWMTEDLVGVD